GRSVGHLGGGLFAGRPRRLSEAHLGQDDRRYRPLGRRILARKLRPGPYPQARLEDARPETRRQDTYLLRRHGQLLFEQRGLPGRGVFEGRDKSVLRWRGGLRRPRRTLLERRS